MAYDATKTPVTTGKVEEKVPSVSEKAKPETKAEAPLQDSFPDKLKGKSPEEIVKIYGELEKKLGEQSSEVKQARDTQEKMNLVLQAIWRNPDLYRGVEREIQSLASGDAVLTDRKPSEFSAGEEGKEEAGKPKEASKGNDERRYLENQIISEFQRKFGLERLPAQERQELMQKVSTTWANMLDPKGRKTKQELLSSVELDTLPTQLENAYWLSHKESLARGGQPYQDVASVGSMPTGSGKSEEGEALTPKEKETADKLGVSPDRYIKRKQQIINEFTKE
jgi:hypothetical protein